MTPLRRLLSYFKPYRGKLIFGVACVLGTNLAKMRVPFEVKHAIDSFEAGVTDSRPEKLTALECLGFLKGSACPHYTFEKERKPSYQRMLMAGELKDGVACDDGAAILYENEQLVKVVAVTAKARAYRVRREGDKIVEELLKVEQLTTRK